jgi:hypothetical protein
MSEIVAFSIKIESVQPMTSETDNNISIAKFEYYDVLKIVNSRLEKERLRCTEDKLRFNISSGSLYVIGEAHAYNPDGPLMSFLQ